MRLRLGYKDRTLQKRPHSRGGFLVCVMALTFVLSGCNIASISKPKIKSLMSKSDEKNWSKMSVLVMLEILLNQPRIEKAFQQKLRRQQ